MKGFRKAEQQRLTIVAYQWDEWRAEPEGASPPDHAWDWQVIRALRVAQRNGLDKQPEKIRKLVMGVLSGKPVKEVAD